MIPLALLALGALFILRALRTRDEPRKAFVLFAVGALLVVAGGIAALHQAELS